MCVYVSMDEYVDAQTYKTLMDEKLISKRIIKSFRNSSTHTNNNKSITVTLQMGINKARMTRYDGSTIDVSLIC